MISVRIAALTKICERNTHFVIKNPQTSDYDFYHRILYAQPNLKFTFNIWKPPHLIVDSNFQKYFPVDNKNQVSKIMNLKFEQKTNGRQIRLVK